MSGKHANCPILIFVDRSCSKKLSKLLEGNLGSSTTLWKEVEDSFVSTVVGANADATMSKL